MNDIGGNIIGVLQTAAFTVNSIGEQAKAWTDAQEIFGWLDLMAGSTGYSTYNAKIQESTHVFLCDYVELPEGVEAETARMVIAGKVYDVTYIDDPMGLHEHLEIFLKYTGGR
ncbi:MAG: hypothetical protein IJV91_05660 [Kiritimatiellae bacterium]|nr:hypothetical protein [Kiritimatiellia bacterium]